MGKYLKLFSTHAEYQAFKQTSDFIKPNVSHCVQENEVHYNPWVETRVVAKFNVTSTSSATKIMDSDATSQFSEIEIDGVVQPSVVYSYKFDTLGEHTVKYTLTDTSSIGYGAFQDCHSLTSVTIPNSVTSIGSSAFENCSGLTNVVIPNSVTSIVGGAFAWCSSLTSITIPNSVTTIGDYAFSGCRSLTSIDIPNNVTSIGSSAFENCSGLTNVVIPNSVTSIVGGAFAWCSSLTSITIPNSVTTIGDNAFNNCI